MAEHLFQQVFRNFGVPEDIVSDRGPQFISHVWKAFFRLLGVTVSLSSGYHPQTNGQIERKIQELGRYLRAYCQEDQHSWSRFLPWAEYAQNSLRQNTTGLTPFQCILGYQPPLFPWTGEPSEVPAVDHWFRASERVWDSAHIHLQRAVRRHKDFADVQRAPTPLYHPGDRVWLSTRAPTPPALQEAESPLHWSVQDPEADKWGYLPTPTPRPGIVSIPHSMFPSWNRVLLQPQISTSRTSLLLQKSWINHPSTRSATSWTRGDGVAGWSISWTGKDTDSRSSPGWPGTIF